MDKVLFDDKIKLQNLVRSELFFIGLSDVDKIHTRFLLTPGLADKLREHGLRIEAAALEDFLFCCNNAGFWFSSKAYEYSTINWRLSCFRVFRYGTNTWFQTL